MTSATSTRCVALRWSDATGVPRCSDTTDFAEVVVNLVMKYPDQQVRWWRPARLVLGLSRGLNATRSPPKQSHHLPVLTSVKQLDRNLGVAHVQEQRCVVCSPASTDLLDGVEQAAQMVLLMRGMILSIDPETDVVECDAQDSRREHQYVGPSASFWYVPEYDGTHRSNPCPHPNKSLI